MRLKVSKSKNAASFYVIKTVYVNGKEKTITVEKLGTEAQLREKLNGEDPYVWAKKYVEELNKKEKESLEPVIMTEFNPNKQLPITSEKALSYGGYLYLQKIYHELKLDKICKNISLKHKFKYDINDILSKLVFSRILYPKSKAGTYELSKKYLEQSKFQMHHIYRTLEVLAEESSQIQASLYKNSLDVIDRNTCVLYYDCTNFFFEIEEEEGLKQYGYSKEHRPNPIVQMGLFMDGNGIPLAFDINPGNTNEQTTMKPLEKTIIQDFNLSKFVVCTDAGLSSNANRLYNNYKNRAYVTTQSVKKLKKHLKEWALDPTNWQLKDSSKTYDIRTIDEEKFREAIFFKERWIKENGLEERLIITYSVKYKEYLRAIRERHLNRCVKLIQKGPSAVHKKAATDSKKYISEDKVTPSGEVAETSIFTINEELIRTEERYDGIYAVCTNLEDDVQTIIGINKRRWKIEECFRIMKTEFKARPVYLKRDDRIKAHFLTCFIALLIFRILEAKLENKYTCQEIISALKEINFVNLQDKAYRPTFIRTELIDDLNALFDFRTDYEAITIPRMKEIIKKSKSNKIFNKIQK